MALPAADNFPCELSFVDKSGHKLVLKFSSIDFMTVAFVNTPAKRT
jgi:hypothetical protein